MTQPSGTRALAGPGANLFGANLSGTQLSGINLSGANLGKANLSGANLTGTHLTGANLAGANLTGANIEDALVCTLDADCDDSDPCTADTCQSGGCVSEPMGNCCSNDDCDDGQPCTLNTCEQNQCVTAPITTGCCIGGSCQAVFDTPQSTFTLPAVSGEGIYYPDVQASFPDVQWDTLDRLYIPAGQYKYITLNNLPNRSKDKPLIITNKGGQVWVGALGHYYLFSLGGGSNWILTGRWDPVGKTGHHSLAGHAGNHYANTAGTYGIIIDDAFVKDGLTGLGVGGGATNFEVEFMEITRVGFAGMSIKSDGYPDAHMYDVKVHDMYIHDTGSEGFYFGSTQTQPQHRIMGLQLYNNRVLRAGTELIQIGQVGGDTRIHHNVFMLGALDWKDPFQGYQDNASQLASRQGSVEIDHNIFIGGADSMLNFHPQEVEGDVHQAGDRVHVHDNYYSHGRHLGTFVGSNSDGKTVYRFENNVYREMVFSYDELYPGKAPHNEHFRVNHNQINTVEIIGNTWDGPTAIASNLPNVITEGNVNGPSDPVAFHDAGFEPDFDFFRVEMWGAKSGIQQNAPIDYEPGDYVVHKGLFYRCIATESHTNRPPQDHPDTWELLPSLPDDVRLAPGSPHGAVGLLDTVP